MISFQKENQPGKLVLLLTAVTKSQFDGQKIFERMFSVFIDNDLG